MDELLTICIPTYNRCNYLKICLDSVFVNIRGLEKYIRVIVSDNCSTDDTKTVVKLFESRGYQFEYFCQEKNIGTERNFEFLYNKVGTKFFWIIGDDDFILDNRLEYIISLLKNNNFGILHLGHFWYEQLDETTNIPFQPKIKEYLNNVEFINDVHYWITFLSANIVNKSILMKGNLDYKDTMLDYIKWYLPIVFKSTKNIILLSPVVACKANNSGGYNLFKVFGSNFNYILSDLVQKRLIPMKAKRVIIHNLISSFFPYFLKNGTTTFEKGRAILILFFTYYNNLFFWKKIVFQTVINFLKNLRINLKRKESFNLKFLGKNSSFGNQNLIKNPQYICIGDNFSCLDRLRIEAWDEYQGESFSPKIIIGNNVCFNTDIHIGCINRIEIGDNCLFGSRIYITDHDHGDTSPEDLRITPANRKLKSKGPVIIENNVYVGEGVAILSGVQIGENAIIATNSVVTKDVPKNSVVAGIPARIIKSI
jgi:acetyltransferase-like isoleucine patch superfamily enzyme